MVHGRYGEFKVFIDDKVIVDGGPKVLFGIMPSVKEIITAVQRQS
jgi:hypothetical protein